VIYDWASSAFATTVMSGFFPIFFKQYWNVGVDPTVSTFRLGVANSTGSLTVAVLAPLLGAVADAEGARKRFMIWLTGVGVSATAALAIVGSGGWVAAAIIYILAIIGFSGANIFYDALLVAVAPRERADYISALGFAIGYLGGGILFALNVAMTLSPGTFGLDGADAAVRASFVLVAVWWAFFSIPAALWVREPPPVDTPGARGVTAGFVELRATFREIRRYRLAFMFLLGYWFYIDGVHTIVRMAVDYGLALGFPANSLIAALLLVQFVGFPSSIAFGKLGQRIGAKRAIFIGLSVYTLVAIWGSRLQHLWEFYAMAAIIGLVQGGVTSLSRSFYSRLIPRDKSAQFFGFYNALGRFAAVLGPLLMGTVSVATGNPRLSILSIISLFLIGAFLLALVPAQEPEEDRAA